MNRSEILLAVLASAEGSPYTPVQIQKATFLVVHNLPWLQERLGFQFRAYDYGPFDSQVYQEAELLALRGLALIYNPGGRWRTYAASPAGIVEGRRVLANVSEGEQRYIRSVSTWVRSLDFASLVKSIYEAYPDMRKNSIFQG